ncbi:MAG: hypothetical protein ACRETA_11755 [Gammaproteobacteria bacterium]
MQEQEFDFEVEDNAATTGMKWLGRVLAIVVILVVAAFGDVMYIQLMTSKFPAGPLLIVCYIGAFTSFLAIVYMLIGKSVLFTPGRQMVLAWLIFAAELMLIAMNIILVFQADGAGATGFLAAWLQLAPATPVVNMAGVAVLFFLDEDGKMHHEDVEMQYDMKRANRRHYKAMARARLRLQTKQLNFLVTELDRAVSSPESMHAIQQTATDLNTHLLGQLSGGRTYRAPAQLPAPTTVTTAGVAPVTPVTPVTPEPVTVESDRERALLRASFRKQFRASLGRVFGGSRGKVAKVTLAQTGELPAQEPVVVESDTSVQEPVVEDEGKSKAPDEHRACSECSKSFKVKNAKQLTCSDACRSKRARRLAGERSAKGKQG